MTDHRTIRLSQRTKDLHVEAPGAVVNIRTGLHDADGNPITAIEVLPDRNRFESPGWYLADFGNAGSVNVRVRQGEPPPPDGKYWMQARQPDRGPHEHDHKNGIIYGFLYIDRNGKPCRVDLQDRFERVGHEDDWSWGNAGLKTKTVFQAEEIARKVLGDEYGGKL